MPIRSILLATATLLATTLYGADLAPQGTLRVTFLQSNPVHSGPVENLASALAVRLKVPYKLLPAANTRAVMDNLLSGAADVGLLAYDATRAAEVDFSNPWAMAMNSYLVRADSPLKTVEDVDRAGVRIAAAKGDSGELWLSRNLKNAKLLSITGLDQDEGYRMLMASEAEAYGANRSRLALVEKRPGVRTVTGDFSGVDQRFAIAKGDRSRLDALNAFIDFARGSGVIQSAIDKSKLTGVRVAPAPAR